MSLVRYSQEREDDCGSSLSWARAEFEGAPFRSSGAAPYLREDEFDTQTHIVKDAKVKIFDLSDPKQVLEYQQVLERAAAGWYHIWRDDTKFIEETQSWKVLCVWFARFQEQKPKL